MSQEVYYPFEQEQKSRRASVMMVLSLGMIVLALVLGVVMGGRGDSAGPGAGDNFVHFKGTTVFGENVNTEDFEGEVIVVDFWATWCPPCVEKMPEMIALQSEFAEDGVRFLGVSGDVDAARLKAFEEERGTNFPTIFTGAETVLAHYGIRSLPTVIIVGRDGRIILRENMPDLRSAIREALE